ICLIRFWLMRPLFRVASIAYICYTVPGQLSSPKSPSSSQPARRPLMLWRHWWNLVCGWAARKRDHHAAAAAGAAEPNRGAVAGVVTDSADGSGLLGHRLILRIEAGLRHRLRQPGTGREIGNQRIDPAATGGAGPELERFPGRAPVCRAAEDATGANHGAGSDYADRRRSA